MPTLISYYTSDGERGHCDSKCYDASGPDCHCVCHGLNHSKGLEQARANTDQLAEQWIELCQQDRELPENTVWKVNNIEVVTSK